MPSAPKRTFLECEKATAEEIKIFCFLKRISVKSFVTKTLQKEIEPYKEWIKLIKEIP